MSNPYDAIIGGEQQDGVEQPSNPYDKAISDDLNTVNTMRAQAAAKAAEVNPQSEKKVRSTAQRIGIAPDLLRDNMEEAERALKKQDLEDEVGQFSNYSQQFLMENDNLGVLQDDLPRLKALDQAISNTAYHNQERQAKERGFFSNTARGFGERGADLLSNLMEFGNNLANEGEAFIQNQGIPNPGVSYGTLEEFEAQGRQPDMVIGGYGIEFRGDIPAAETDGIQPLANAVDVELGYQPYFTSERIKEDITAGNIAGFIGEQGLVSIPDMLAAMFATPAYIASRTEEIGEDRVANDLREGQPELADLAAAAPAAVASALIERFAGFRLFNPKTATVAGTIGASVVREGATEFVQEQIEYAGGTVGTETPFDVMTSLETGAWAALAGAGMGGGISSLQQVYARTAEYNRSKRDKSYLKQVGDAANESETDKQVLRDMIARSKAGGPVSEVYVDATEFRTLFQSAGLDPDAIADRMPSIRETYYESAAIGGDLAISLEDYATVIPETAVYEGFLDLVRTEPSGMSGAEAQQWYDEQAKPMIEAAMQYDPAAENPGGDQVEQDVVGQLLATGLDQATAERNAAPIKAFFTVLGNYEGRDPFELYQEYGLSIGQPRPEILQRGQQVDEFDNMLSRLRAGEIPTEQEIEGQSLVQFLRESGGLLDDGGELSAMDADEGRAAFEKKLVQETGLSLDAAAELAAEAGYITERDPNQLLDRINNELRGNPVYSPANANDQLRTLAADLIELDDALREAGIDPGSMTNEEIRAAIMDEQPAGEVEFDQDSLRELYEAKVHRVDVAQAEILADIASGTIPQEVGSFSELHDYVDANEYVNDSEREDRVFGPAGVRAGLDTQGFIDNTGDMIEALDRWIKEGRKGRAADFMPVPQTQGQLFQPGTEAFANWFGDSKVVDANGEPLVVYHGTGGDFSSFDPQASDSEGGQGVFFFSNNPYVSGTYAPRTGGNVMPVYLSVKNPLVAGIDGEPGEGASMDDWREFVREVDNFNRGLDDSKNSYFEEKIQQARDEGRDGVVFRNIEDSGMPGVDAIESDIWVVFQPTQIKSATGNRGTFDPNDTNILNQSPMFPESNRLSNIPRDGGVWSAIVSENPQMANVGDTVTVYRATVGDDLRFNDFVAINPDIAESHLENLRDRGEDGKIISREVPVSDLLMANDATEFVYAPEPQELNQSRQRDANRGRILIDRANKNFNIELLEGADLSTFLHETGHYFLEVLGDIESNVNTSDRTRKMYQDLLDWMGVDSRDDIGVEQHELFARTFEAYLREGKAPTPELRNVFKRFSAWLKQIYRSLTQLDAKLTDEVRSVFDRMLATDEEIQQAQEDAGYLVSLEDVEGIEWSEDEKRQLAEMKEDARAQAESDLMAEQMKDISKSQQEWWEKERAQVSREMWDSLNASPQYQARQMLTAGKRANGDPLPAGVDQLKLSKQALVDEFGAEFLKELPSPRNPNNKAPQYPYAAKGGEDPAVVARAYGYGSARELVNALIESKPVKEYVAALTEAEMRQRHPDINLSGQAAEIARESVYNDKQAQLMLLELKKLEAMAGRKPSIPKVMRDKAADIIASKKVRDIRPDVYANKTRKLGREAFDAARKGQIDQAMLAKQREIMHHYLYKEALKARQQSEKVYAHAKRLQKKAAQERIGKAGGEYLDRINDLLSKYEFRRVSNREIERRQSFAEWLKGREADGDYVDVPAEVVERSQRVNWRDIPMEELIGVDDALKNLEHTARMKNKLLADKDKRDLEEVLRPVVDQVLAKGDKAGRGFFEKDTLSKRAQRGARDYASAALNMDTILRGLDGYEDLGVVYQAIKAPIDRASREDLPAQQEKFGNRLAEIYNKHFTREEQRHLGRQDYVQLSNGKWLSRDEALSLALNLGNEGNLEAVYSGVASAKEQLQPADIQKIRDSLQKSDWEFVQDVWDMMDFELWPMVRDVQKGRTGVAPKKVEATPVQTKFGTYRGGYYPIKFDPGLSFRATEQEADQMAQQVRFGSFAKAQTQRGHTIERTNSGGNPLNYSLSVLHSHIDQALVDVTLGNAINDVSRIITHRDFVNAMQRTGNTWALKAMENWLKDTASQEVVSSHFLSRAVRHIRVGFTMSKLAWNVGTILLQPMGLAQSIPDIGYRNMMAGLTAANPSRWFGENNIFSQIQEKSPFMRSRGASFNKDIRDTNAAIKGSGWTEAVLERIPGMKGISQPVAEMLKESLMGGIVATQQVVDAVVWMGAYQKGKTDFTTDAEAIQYADMMVARTQASGIFSDRTSFERGTIDNQTRQSEFVRLWTTLGSYMFAKGNIAYEKTANTDFSSPESVLKWMHDMFMLFTFETIMIALMKGLLPGEDDEETVAGFLAEETVYNVMGTMPLLREASSALAGFSGGGVLGSFWADFAKIKTQAEQGEVDAPLLKALNNTGGVLFKYPSSQMNRIADAFWRDINGEDVKIMDYLMYNEFDE